MPSGTAYAPGGKRGLGRPEAPARPARIKFSVWDAMSWERQRSGCENYSTVQGRQSTLDLGLFEIVCIITC